MFWRIHGYLVIAIVLAAVSVPFSWPARRDSFPISSYPMFSSPTPTPRLTLSYAVAVEPGGGRHHLAPALVANGEVLQARAVLGQAARRGQAALEPLCERIAARVADERRQGDELARVTEVRIVTGTHDAVEYVTGRDRTGSERVHARCAIPRSAEVSAP